MKYTKNTLAMLLVLLIGGCMPMKQGVFEGGKGYDHFGFYKGYGLLTTGSCNKKKTATIIPEASYALSSNGTKHVIETEPHPYDLKSGHAYVRDRVYVIAKDGRKLESLRDGHWTFHFVLDSPSGRMTRKFEGDESTFFLQPSHSRPSKLSHGCGNSDVKFERNDSRVIAMDTHSDGLCFLCIETLDP